jgi:predicted PhzF superfamily epimerase YddE/YHI9
MKTYFVDAFTNEKFKGNPAAVCIVEKDIDNTTMQNIATEIGFSETAFIRKIKDNIYSIRFFTPKMEIPLCGHATLASSKIIFATTALENIIFITYEHTELKIGKVEDKIVMQFPLSDTFEITVPKMFLEALGINKIVTAKHSAERKIILLEIENTDTLDFDFHYRYFWPWAGTNEDPVTGGVQTFLTKYWATKLGKTKLNSFQSSSRTGSMTTELLTDKVLIYGEALIVLEGEFKNVDEGK